MQDIRSAVAWGVGKGKDKRKWCKKSKKASGGDGYVNYTDCGGGHMGEYVCSDLVNYTF